MLDKVAFCLLGLVFIILAVIAFTPNYILVETDHSGHVIGHAIVFPISRKLCEQYIEELSTFGERGTIMTCVLVKTHKIPD